MTTALRHTERAHQRAERVEAPPATADAAALARTIDGILNRHPSVGLAVCVVRDGDLAFVGRGLADVATKAPITEDTVFRIGSVTKLFTAIAVMQLVEEGRVDLDAPANDSLRAYRLDPAKAGFRPATIRHLLTHTAGIPEVVHLSDLFHPGWGPFGARPAELSVPFGERLPSLAEYYGGGLRVAVEPGTAFQYTNHGFATLGQIVEDVSGIPRERYYRERLFEPLGMTDTDLVRSRRLAARLATGYVLARRGPTPVPDREWICRLGAGGIYSTTRDMARFVSAVLGGGANEHGRVLDPATLATMFEPHYRPDPRLPGRGLGFVRGEAAGHPVIGHDGLLPGFDSNLLIAPDDGLGIVAFTNGSPGAHTWLGTELDRVLRDQLGVPADAVRSDIPQHPEIWPELCGRYRLPPGSDLRGRLAMGAGAEVLVRGGRLMVRVLTPVPVLFGGFPLRPADEQDPDLLALDLSRVGMPPVRVAFSRGDGVGVSAVHVDLPGQPLTLFRQGAMRSPRAWPMAALGGLAVAASVAIGPRLRRVTRSASAPRRAGATQR
jgi:CubicO group peptidase (beta-lactamase class C family)